MYFLFAALLAWQTIQSKNASAFVFPAMVPYAFLLTYRFIRKPFYPIKSKIEQTDPVLYRDIIHKSKSLRQASPIKESQEEKLFIFTLMKFKESIQNPEMKAYAYNTNFLVVSSMVTLSIWFIGTFLAIYLVSFLK
jgi:hypothetical protein